jgi:hypothetical protein
MSQRYIVRPNGMLQVYPPETYVPKNHYERHIDNSQINPHYSRAVVNPYTQSSNPQYSKAVVNPYTQSSNPQYSKAVVNPYTQSSNPQQHSINNNMNVKTPYPDFDCAKRGVWSKDKDENNEMINDCIQCLQDTSPDDKAFYCDGMCTSEYSLNKGQCDYNSLVASNVNECKSPCQQSIPDVKNRDLRKNDRHNKHDKNDKNDKNRQTKFRDLKSSSGCKTDSECGSGQSCVIKNTIGEDGSIQAGVGVCEEKNPIYDADKDQKTMDIINAINNCINASDMRICVADFSNMSEKEIKSMIEDKIKSSKEDKTFDTDKEKIIKLLQNFDDTDIISNGYNAVDKTISNLNIVIKELNDQYDLDSKNKGDEIDLDNSKVDYIIKEVKSDKNIKNKLSALYPQMAEPSGKSNSFVPPMSDSKKNMVIIIGGGVIIFLILVLIFVLIFYRKGNDKLPSYKSIY